MLQARKHESAHNRCNILSLPFKSLLSCNAAVLRKTLKDYTSSNLFAPSIGRRSRVPYLPSDSYRFKA